MRKISFQRVKGGCILFGAVIAFSAIVVLVQEALLLLIPTWAVIVVSVFALFLLCIYYGKDFNNNKRSDE